MARIYQRPRRAQLFILLITYLIGFSYCFLLFQAHTNLKNVYHEINPNATLPSLSLASINRDPVNISWLPKSPLASDGPSPPSPPLPGAPTLEASDPGQPQPTGNSTRRLPPLSDVFRRIFGLKTTKQAAIEQKQQDLTAQYITAQFLYVVNFNALVLFCAVAAGAGLRFAYFILFQIAFTLTIIAATIYNVAATGFDGQALRFLLFTMAVLVACLWITRPLESEARKWYLMKYNYRI